MSKEKNTHQSINGIRLGTACAGIKKNDHRDLVLIEIAESSQVAAVFTQNAFCAAPVIVAKDHFSKTTPRYLLINTGNANAGTGKQGIADTLECCKAVATVSGCDVEDTLPFSTGVIGESLAVDKIVAGIKIAYNQLAAEGWDDASNGILTTDTRPKLLSESAEINGKTVTVTGMAKGSGMIRPNMATMLAYCATDAMMDADTLQQCLQSAVDASFNRITVDGDTSTNDACILIATGKAGVTIENGSKSYTEFYSLLESLCIKLAKDMVRDAEGATKLINIVVNGGVDTDECQRVAYTIAHSPLVKTAFFASDPNWGRILAAVGRSGIESLELNKLKIFLDDVCIVSNGGRDPAYQESDGQKVMDQSEITIRVDMGRGSASDHVWTCDFSYDYVRINAEYRT
jgi:glutamate N-acetyltransferase/amino-acid N-acetyltransferase